MNRDKPGSTNTKNARRRLIRNIVIVVLGIGACAGVSYVAFLFVIANALANLFPEGCPSTEPAAVESMARFKLPPSASNLRSTCGGLQGWWAEAHFDMKPSDLETFVSTTSVKLPLSTTGKPEKTRSICPEMEQVTQYLYGTYDSFDWFEEILIDTSNPDRYHVYFTVLAG